LKKTKNFCSLANAAVGNWTALAKSKTFFGSFFQKRTLLTFSTPVVTAARGDFNALVAAGLAFNSVAQATFGCDGRDMH
jgi:hypothetical protein